MTAPPIKAGDATTGGLWAFDRSAEWRSRYPLCSNKATRISPLNIDTNNELLLL